jgi:Flp pilus assembly protein TadG
LPRRCPLRHQHGQTLTEFALVLPLLLFLLLAILQLGIAFNNYISLTEAVRVGARKGAVARQLSDPEAAVAAEVRDSAAELKAADVDVTVTSSWARGEDVTVTATYPYSINLLGVVVKSGELTSKAKERVE